MKILSPTICAIAISALSLGLSTPSVAKSPTKLSSQINYLMESMHKSDCLFVRNGKAYPKDKAAKHLKKKWLYAKDGIDTIDAFINEIASKSWFTGREYQVICEDKLTSSENWLKHQLSGYRAAS